MMNIDPGLLALLMFGALLIGVCTGYPLAFVVGIVSLVSGYVVFGPGVFSFFNQRVYAMVYNYTLLAIPLFIYMGMMLQQSGISERMYAALYVWLGGLRGGLAIVTVIMGAIMAACVGVVGASVTMLGLVALPSMLSRGYDKSVATGSVCGGGTLGVIIPPSVPLVVYGTMAYVSVGKLFMGAIMPGLLLTGLYVAMIAGRAFMKPGLAPAIPIEERQVPFAQKTRMLVTSLLPTAILIFAVLGVIFFGIAAPTEAAAVGALASTLLALGYKRLNLQVLKDVTLGTLKVSSMIFMIAATSFAFTGVFLGAGAGNTVQDMILAAPGGRWSGFLVLMAIIFVLGYFIDVLGVIFIMVPILGPLIPQLGFDPLWFAIMFNLNLQTAWLTPPYAVSIFYLAGVLKPEWGINTSHIIRGVIPYILLIIVGTLICIAFPDIILWLPRLMIK